MSTNNSSGTAIVKKVDQAIVPVSRPSRKAHIEEEDAIPRRPVEVVTEEEKRHEEQVRHKAAKPESFFENAPRASASRGPGAEVTSEVALGFLAAMEKIVPNDNTYPILSSVKLSYRAGSDDRLYIEAHSTNVWTIAALEAKGRDSKGFIAAAPLRRSKNVLRALSDQYKRLVIGVDEVGVCIGPNRVPFGGRAEDFPSPPVVLDWEARAAMPAFYLEEICSRVAPARSKNDAPDQAGFHGVLLDFEDRADGDLGRILCTAVATDGARMHILELPQMVVELKDGATTLPPTVLVPDGFFRYLAAVVNREWAALELGEEQVVGKGQDFVAVAKAAMRGKIAGPLSSWRSAADVDYGGFWMADRLKLEQSVRSVMGSASEISLSIDGRYESMEVVASSDGDLAVENVSIKSFDGAPVVQVKVDPKLFLDSVRACKTGLIRLGFHPDPYKQKSSPVLVRGDDEQFKALVMPRA